MTEMSLRNIDQFSKQEIFDFVAGKLLAQGIRSVFPNPYSADSIRCSYHNEACDMNGPKCAVGHILSVEEHLKIDELEINGKGVSSLVQEFGYEELVHVNTISFLGDLQGAHDQGVDPNSENYSTEAGELGPEFIRRMKQVAKRYDLNTDALEKTNA